MKKLILVTILNLMYCFSFGQSIQKTNIEKIESFYLNSPVHKGLDKSLFNYKKGNMEYYPKGKNVPWGSYYMPLINGGLATRWKVSKTTFPKSNNLHSWDQIKSMSIDEIALLSPAEKMDIYLGNKNFLITKNELIHRGPERKLPIVKSWEGFCNGMRAAGVLLPEPEHEIIVRSKQFNDPIYVKFYPGDLKALAGAIYYWAEWIETFGENDKSAPNPGLFDVLMRDAIGKQQRSFFIDVMPGDQKWNETIVGYKRETLNETIISTQTNLPINTQKIIDIKLTLYQLDELDLNDNTTQERIENRDLVTTWIANYSLYVDQNDLILGGKWSKYYKLNDPLRQYSFDTPDYIWLAGGIGTDNLHGLPQSGNIFYNFYDIQNLVFYSTF